MKIKKIKPLYNHIVTTANVYSNSSELVDENNVAGQFKEYQTVVSVGHNVSGINVGDVVLINPKSYARPVHKAKEDSITGLMTQDEVEMVIQFPIIEINDTPHLFLYDRDVECIIEEFSEEEDNLVD